MLHFGLNLQYGILQLSTYTQYCVTIECVGSIITPRLLKGFRDFLPPQQIVRQELLGLLSQVLMRSGFVPIDTPLLEYTEILLSKGGGQTEKQIYRFFDQGGRDVALRFDLTIPLARYVAQHAAELHFPLRCYHIGKVFRGENTQRGRYREFMQFDFDIVGAQSAIADFDILQVIIDLFRAINTAIVIHFSHRDLLPAFISRLSPNHILQKHIQDVRIIIDKLPKKDPAYIRKQLVTLLPVDEQCHIDPLLEFIEMGRRSQPREALEYITHTLNPSQNSRHITQLLAYFDRMLHWAELSDCIAYLSLSPHITRGLDYYTGLIFETFATSQPEIGAICSGGRYDNLASLYTTERFAGVGGSIGIDRLLTLSSNPTISPPAVPDLLIIMRDQKENDTYIELSHQLRIHGMHCEIYPHPVALRTQLEYADTKGIVHSLNWHPPSVSQPSLELRNHQLRISRHCRSLESILTLFEIYTEYPEIYQEIYRTPPNFDDDYFKKKNTDSLITSSSFQKMLRDIHTTHKELLQSKHIK